MFDHREVLWERSDGRGRFARLVEDDRGLHLESDFQLPLSEDDLAGLMDVIRWHRREREFATSA
jgi:hypothetical protein